MRAPADERTPLPKANDACFCGSGQKFKRCHKDSFDPIRPGTISPMRPVPDDIVKPHWAATGEVTRYEESHVRTPDVIDRMRRTGALAGEILRSAGELVAPGVTTEAIDEHVHRITIEAGAYPSDLNYNHFRKSVCTSVNEVICHGIPDNRPLRDGDIVNIDVTAYREGVHGDTNATFLVGTVDPESRRLVRVTRECLERAIDVVRPGVPFSAIGKAIEDHAHGAGFGVVEVFVGHGISEQFHTDLHVPHYYEPRLTLPMEAGMTFTIEPMITMGTIDHVLWPDGWTAVTADKKRTAQFEHTLLVTDDGCDVLTR